MPAGLSSSLFSIKFFFISAYFSGRAELPPFPKEENTDDISPSPLAFAWKYRIDGIVSYFVSFRFELLAFF